MVERVAQRHRAAERVADDDHVAHAERLHGAANQPGLAAERGVGLAARRRLQPDRGPVGDQHRQGGGQPLAERPEIGAAAGGAMQQQHGRFVRLRRRVGAEPDDVGLATLDGDHVAFRRETALQLGGQAGGDGHGGRQQDDDEDKGGEQHAA